jgi:SAM-dependent methyltransferase
MTALYDTIGQNYVAKRRTDPRIATQLHAELFGAKRIVNIGAGTGSYEPYWADLIAVEPSGQMISQRAANAHPVEKASAESLPFPDKHFSHAMTVLSMHHWQDKAAAFAEITRVTSEKFVAVSWDPGAPPFWLTRDYFPEFHAEDLTNFPSLSELESHFDDVRVTPLPIPADCQDGFLAAFWKRPSAYLDPSVQQSISSFAKASDTKEGLLRLQTDLADGSWHRKNQAILDLDELDAGYRLITARIR